MADDYSEKTVPIEISLVELLLEHAMKDTTARVQLFQGLRATLLKRIKSENPDDYRKYFCGDSVRQSEWFAERAAKYNQKIRTVIQQIDAKIASEIGPVPPISSLT